MKVIYGTTTLIVAALAFSEGNHNESMPFQEESDVAISSLEDFRRSNPNAPPDLEEAGTAPTLAVQWKNAEQGFWILRLNENFGNRYENWGLQPDADWKTDGHGNMFYLNSPVSTKGIEGNCTVRVRVLPDSIKFETSVTNETSRDWVDCWGWVCLIHRWAQAFQANTELPVGTPERSWIPASSLPAPLERWLKWIPLEPKKDIALRIKPQSKKWQTHIQAHKGSVRAWRIKPGIQQFVELTSPDAIILGWSHWPCTDMGLYFGTIKPGETAKVSGELKFYEKSFVPM